MDETTTYTDSEWAQVQAWYPATRGRVNPNPALETKQKPNFKAVTRALDSARRGARWNQEQLAEFVAAKLVAGGIDPEIALEAGRYNARMALGFAQSVQDHHLRQTRALAQAVTLGVGG